MQLARLPQHYSATYLKYFLRLLNFEVFSVDIALRVQKQTLRHQIRVHLFDISERELLRRLFNGFCIHQKHTSLLVKGQDTLAGDRGLQYIAEDSDLKVGAEEIKISCHVNNC